MSHLERRASGASQDWQWLGDSEMAGRVRAFDWRRTLLGPIEAWPSSLKSAVGICLHSAFQMAVYWGPDLNFIYNDAEIRVLGNLHPGALGLPARELLRDSWEITGSQLRRVMEAAETTWLEDQPLRFDRRGTLEVVYFTYSYSPIRDDRGTVRGVLLVTQDTTARVLAQRRLDALRELTAGSMDARTERQACEQVADALAGGGEVAFALTYLCERGRARAECLAASAGWGRVEPAHGMVDFEETLGEPLLSAARFEHGRGRACCSWW